MKLDFHLLVYPATIVHRTSNSMLQSCLNQQIAPEAKEMPCSFPEGQANAWRWGPVKHPHMYNTRLNRWSNWHLEPKSKASRIHILGAITCAHAGTVTRALGRKSCESKSARDYTYRRVRPNERSKSLQANRAPA